jgi:hypothetical protein
MHGPIIYQTGGMSNEREEVNAKDWRNKKEAQRHSNAGHIARTLRVL